MLRLKGRKKRLSGRLSAKVESVILNKMVLHAPAVKERLQTLHAHIAMDGSFEASGEGG